MYAAVVSTTRAPAAPSRSTARSRSRRYLVSYSGVQSRVHCPSYNASSVPGLTTQTITFGRNAARSTFHWASHGTVASSTRLPPESPRKFVMPEGKTHAGRAASNATRSAPAAECSSVRPRNQPTEFPTTMTRRNVRGAASTTTHGSMNRLGRGGRHADPGPRAGRRHDHGDDQHGCDGRDREPPMPRRERSASYRLLQRERTRRPRWRGSPRRRSARSE